MPTRFPAPGVGRRGERRRLRILLGLLPLLHPPALAGELTDPLPLRGQFPFHLLFLELRPESAAILPRGAWRAGVALTHENTLAATDDLVSLYHGDDFMTYGGEVTLPILQGVAAGNAGGTAYILDTETTRVTIDASLGVAARLEVGVEIPWIGHGRGFMDAPIDSYHDRLDLPDGGRTVFAQEQFRAGYVGDGATVYFDSAGDPGLGDIALRARSLLRRGGPRGTSVTAAIGLKIPTGDSARLHGSGSADAALSLAISRGFKRSTLHAGGHVTWVGDWEIAPQLPLESSEGLYLGYGFAATTQTAVLGQVLWSSGVFPYRTGSDIGRAGTEIAVGVRHVTDLGLRVDYGFLENLEGLHNVPDVGFFLGIGFGQSTAVETEAPAPTP